MNTSTVNTELLSFIDASPTAFHVVRSVTDLLGARGYTELLESDIWHLKPGGCYYVTRNLSSIIAFTVPADGLPSGFMIGAAHTDSPSFKIKESAESESGGYTHLNVERYGGMLCATWFDRPLSAAGKVMLSTDNGIRPCLVNLRRPLFMIPSLAIHMNRKANDGVTYNPASDMQPIAGSVAAKGGLRRAVAALIGEKEERILSYDLFLYPTESGTVWGTEEEYISSPRLDDLQCAFALTKGFLEVDTPKATPVLFLADNEEVGSTTKQGAASTFLADVLLRLVESLGGSASDYRRAVAQSFMVSADNAHAVHPNHPEYADPAHRPMMNGGIVIKHNAAQRYTTDAASAAIFSAICRRAEVPIQHFTNRADLAGGSTLGNIANTQVSLNTVDIGLPQLAMHSCYETAGAKDTAYLIDAMKVFFVSALTEVTAGEYRLE